MTKIPPNASYLFASTAMLEHIQQIDQSLFFFINDGLSNPFFDWLMPYLRNRFFWIPLYAFLVIFLVRNYQKRGWFLVFSLLMTFGIADYTSSSILKPAFERLRPCNDPEIQAEVNTLIACGSGVSLPSSHASKHFAIAFFLITVLYCTWKPSGPLAFLWAAAVSFAQVYSGVHYPADILLGAILGTCIGYGIATALLTTIHSFKQWCPQN